MSKAPTIFPKLPLQNGRYAIDFTEEAQCIGKGSYGTVAKARNEVDEKSYAIKKIIVWNLEKFETKINELKVWAKLDSDQFVQYRASWVEEYDEPAKKQFIANLCEGESEREQDRIKNEFVSLDFALLHLEMELCSFSLKVAMDKIKGAFELGERQLLAPIPYYITSELLKEILLSIDCLHSLHVIHSNLKPENILIKKEPNARFIKIGDFGLSIGHDAAIGTGSMKYLAPEQLTGGPINTKADIYSLGVIIIELFNFDLSSGLPDVKSDHYKKLIELAQLAMSEKEEARPTCANILKLKSEWDLDLFIVKNEIEKAIDLSEDYDIDRDFVNYFLKTKYQNSYH